MFGINRKTAEKVLSELQTQLRQLNQIVYEMDAMISESEKENREVCITERLRQELEKIKLQRKKLLELTSSLRTIVELYEETEEQIMEYEGGVIRKPLHEVAWIPVAFSDETKNFIRQIKV